MREAIRYFVPLMEVHSTSYEGFAVAKKIELESDQAFGSYYEFIGNKVEEKRVECHFEMQSVQTVGKLTSFL